MLHLLFKIFIIVCLLAFFLYSKLLPYKDRLNVQNAKIYKFFNSIFSPLLNFFRGMAKPYQVGSGVAIDTAQFIVFCILVLLTLVF